MKPSAPVMMMGLFLRVIISADFLSEAGKILFLD